MIEPASGEGGLADRWAALSERCRPVLAPGALALALALAGSLLLTALVQFGTWLFEAFPGLALLAAGWHAVASAVLGLMIALRRRSRLWRPNLYGRVSVALLVATVIVFALSLAVLGAKLHYQRGLDGNMSYALPHHPVRYPASAQAVAIKTVDGVRLAGTLLGSGHERAIVIYPAWRTNRDAFAVATLAEWLSNTYTVLVLDPRGQGESEGYKSPEGLEKYDVLAGVAYMRAKGHSRVGVLAEQGAAYPAMLAAATRRDLDSLALVTPVASWGESLGVAGSPWDPRRLSGRVYWRIVAGLRLATGPDGPPALEAVKRVAPTPLLIVGLKADYASPAAALYAAAEEPRSLILQDGEGRPTSWGRFADYYQTIKEWFDLSLQEPADVAPAIEPEPEPEPDATGTALPLP